MGKIMTKPILIEFYNEHPVIVSTGEYIYDISYCRRDDEYYAYKSGDDDLVIEPHNKWWATDGSIPMTLDRENNKLISAPIENKIELPEKFIDKKTGDVLSLWEWALEDLYGCKYCPKCDDDFHIDSLCNHLVDKPVFIEFLATGPFIVTTDESEHYTINYCKRDKKYYAQDDYDYYGMSSPDNEWWATDGICFIERDAKPEKKRQELPKIFLDKYGDVFGIWNWAHPSDCEYCPKCDDYLPVENLCQHLVGHYE